MKFPTVTSKTNSADPEPADRAAESPAAPDSQRGRQKHQRILDAAIEVIAEKGFHSARVADIAERAGVADGTIYLYFRSKEQILMAAIDSALTAFLARAREELSRSNDPREQLRRLAHLHLESLGSHRSLAVVFQTELRQSARFLAEFSHRYLIEYFDLIRKVIRDGQDVGLLRPHISDKIAANCFFGALDEMTTSWLLSERDYPLADAAGPLVDVILGGLETPQA